MMSSAVIGGAPIGKTEGSSAGIAEPDAGAPRCPTDLFRSDEERHCSGDPKVKDGEYMATGRREVWEGGWVSLSAFMGGHPNGETSVAFLCLGETSGWPTEEDKSSGTKICGVQPAGPHAWS